MTGDARDPQTWLEISDHELQFLSERFQALPSFMQSRIHEEFAGDFLMAGDVAGGGARGPLGGELREAQHRGLGDPDRGEREAGP